MVDFLTAVLTEELEKDDPIARLARDLMSKGILSKDAFTTLKESAQAEMDEAAIQVENDPWPDPSEVLAVRDAFAQ